MSTKVKTISSPKIWADKQWTVRYGSAGRGRLEGAPRLCRAQDLNLHAIRHTVPAVKYERRKRKAVGVKLACDILKIWHDDCENGCCNRQALPRRL